MSSACPKCGSTDVAQTDVWKAKLILLPVLILLGAIALFVIMGSSSAMVFIILSPVVIIVCVIIILKQRGRTWRCNQCKAPFFRDGETG